LSDSPAIRALFGPPVPTEGIAATVAATEPSNACEPIRNSENISGLIALVDRGGCDFTDKVKYAQDAGAIAVLVANNGQTSIDVMGGHNASISIPSLFVTQETGSFLRQQLHFGPVVALLAADNVPLQPGESEVTGTFDAWQLRLYGTAKLDGDITLDGRVDAADFNRWHDHQFQTGTTWTTGDLNGDGHTDARDFNIWRQNAFVAVPTRHVMRSPKAPLSGLSPPASVSFNSNCPAQSSRQTAHDEAMKEWNLSGNTARSSQRRTESIGRRRRVGFLTFFSLDDFVAQCGRPRTLLVADL
jgi:hypothetical protein